MGMIETPNCPLLMVTTDHTDKTCRGSTCAWWTWIAMDERRGGCGVGGPGLQSFADPSKKPHPDIELWDSVFKPEVTDD